MTSAAEWVEGARLRTLPAAIAPVLMGSGAALAVDAWRPWRALLALVVALALQVGVNYANDYSDGIRGSDTVRVGPQRLVGSGAASPQQVKTAAFVCFGVAGLAGMVLVALAGQWWLLAVGVLCVLAAWFYTGGDKPYGYRGLGEIAVFIFFGLVATLGTTYTQAGHLTILAWLAALACGALATGVLVANNLRDLPRDAQVGKLTLETKLGDAGSRRLYFVLIGGAALALLAMAPLHSSWLLLGMCAALPLLVPACHQVVAGASGMALVRVLKFTGLAELAAGLGVFVGCLIASFTA